MPPSSNKRIIALLSGLTIITALLHLASKRRAEDVNNEQCDAYDFPFTRAHVYFASQLETINAAIQAAVSLNAAFTRSSDDSLSITLPSSEYHDEITVVAICRSLGSAHTRVALQIDGATQSLDKPMNAATHRVQSAMDGLLIGG